MKKKIVSAVVALCLVLGSTAALPQNAFIDSTSISVSAASTSTSGKCGDNVSWTLKDGVLTISGTGDMYYYNNYDHYTYENAHSNLEKVLFSYFLIRGIYF